MNKFYTAANNKKANFLDAIVAGVLIDVSSIAREIGLLCPTFVTSAFWNSVEISRSEVRVREVLDMSELIHDAIASGSLGSLSFGVGIDSCRWGIGLSALVEHFDGMGTVVVIGDFEEELDFRSPRSGQGGSFYTI